MYWVFNNKQNKTKMEINKAKQHKIIYIKRNVANIVQASSVLLGRADFEYDLDAAADEAADTCVEFTFSSFFCHCFSS